MTDGLPAARRGIAMIGRIVSHYRIVEKIGKGGMGVVYRAEDTKLGRPVALKFLPPELTRDSQAKTRFIQEARAASALDHPNICNIHEIDETEEGAIFIAMACYEGESLEDRIARGPLEIGEAVDIAAQIARGLAKAHERGIVHRDIKPANILITEDGLVKIVDFGLAKLAGAKLTRTGTVVGTARYMSPEQVRGEPVDSRTDVWSLGAVLYEMLTGVNAFPGEYDQAALYAIVNEEPEPVSALRPDVLPFLEGIVGRCLAKDPGERYQDAGEEAAELRRLEAATGVSPAVRGTRERAGGRIRRWAGVAAGVLAAAAAVAAAVLWLQWQRHGCLQVVPKKCQRCVSNIFNKVKVREARQE